MARSPKAERLAEMAATPAEPTPDLLERDDGPEVGGRAPRLPQPCPVIPLGVLGTQIVFLDGLRQIHVVGADCKKGDLKMWFGNDYLLAHFEAKGRGGAPTGKFDQDDVQTAFVADCRAKGIFNPKGKVLGRGAHRPKADEAALVLHLGRSVLVARGERVGQQAIERHQAGMVTIAGKDVFFPAADSLPPPADKPADRAEAAELMQLFGTWNWIEPCGPLLLLGWTAQAFICGWLQWRAHLWLPGPTASGKSSLQAILRALFEEWCLGTSDASEAGIRQTLDGDALPVLIDEAEPHDNPERMQGVLNLMKKSSFGDTVIRGGADHKAQSFEARSCFLLSSVLYASMRGEDRNRVALLEMRKLPEDVAPLEMELAKWRSAGRRLHRRMIEQAPRFERTLALYKRRIGALRFEGRWQDTYGTLLACADLLLYDHPIPVNDYEGDGGEPGMSRVNEAVALVLPLLEKSRFEARPDTVTVISHLVSRPLPGAHGAAPEPVGLWIERAMSAVCGEFPTDDLQPNETARGKLKAHGLKVVRIVQKPVDPRDPDKGMKEGFADALLEDAGWNEGYLAVAYPTNNGVKELFARSDWAGGQWTQSLLKIAGAVGPKKIRFAGPSDNAILVPLSAFRGDEG